MAKIAVASKAKQFTDIIVGNAWLNTDKNGRKYINASINESFGDELVLVAGSAFTLKERTTPKRSGINPKTGKEFRDADYMITVEAA